MNSNKVKQSEQGVPNPSERILTWLFYSPVGANPVPEQVLTYNQLAPWEQTSVKL